MPPTAPAPTERNPLRQRLAALRRRRRLVAAVRGASWLAVVLLTTAAVGGLLDWRWHLPGLVRALLLTGTLAEDELVRRMRNSDALVIMKTGRNLTKVRRALASAGRLDEAWLIERGTMPGERVARLSEVDAAECPYFAIVLVHGQGRRPEFCE